MGNCFAKVSAQKTKKVRGMAISSYGDTTGLLKINTVGHGYALVHPGPHRHQE